jgi:hypothetical protein
LKSIKDEEIEISADETNLMIVSESTEISIPLNLNFDNVLDMIDSLDLEGEWFDLPEDFMEGLKLCKFAVSDNYNDPRGLFQICIGKKIYSSDAFRASIYDFKEDVPYESFLLPKGSIDSILSFEPLSVSFQEGWVHFENKDSAFMSCRVSGEASTFPKIERFFDEETPYKLTFPPELKTTIENVMGVYDESSDASKIVNIQVEEDKIICLIDKNTIRVKKIIPFENKSVFSFKISAVFLIELLGITTTISLSDKKALFSNENFKHVILLAQYSVVLEQKKEKKEKPKLLNRKKLREVHTEEEKKHKKEVEEDRSPLDDDIPF